MKDHVYHYPWKVMRNVQDAEICENNVVIASPAME